MSTSRSRRLLSFANRSIRSLMERSGSIPRSLRGGLVERSGPGVDRLEQRELLSADELPQGAAWRDWAGERVAAITGSYIVTFEDYLGKQNAALWAQDVARALGVEATNVEGIGRGMWASFSTTSPLNFAQAMAKASTIPGVVGIEPNRVYKPARVPNDPEYTRQYFLNNTGQPIEPGVTGTPGADISAEDAWEVSIGSRDVIVGVIDTGVNYNHPDLAANIWRNPNEIEGDGIDNDGNGFVDDIRGYDFGALDNDPQDQGGHGTPVAGLIGAVGNNGIGISGVNWLVSILPLKISDANGRLSTNAIIGAHDYATDLRQRGVNVAVTNNSYGGYQPEFYEDEDGNPIEGGFPAERAAIQRWIDSGGIFVASAGNDGLNLDEAGVVSYPASYNVPGVISVAATDFNDNLAGFSNFGPRLVDIAAAGVLTLSTSASGGYEQFGGTSAAGPIVAGAAALLKAIKPSASSVDIRETLINTSDPLPALVGRVRSGGRVNVARAVRAITVDGPVVQSTLPGPVTTTVDPVTGGPLSTVTIRFSEVIRPDTLTSGSAEMRSDGLDNIFGTGDDVLQGVSRVQRLDQYWLQVDPSDADGDRNDDGVLDELQAFDRQAIVVFGAPLNEDNYRLTLFNGAFRDLNDNRLNGNAASGQDFVTTIRVNNTTGTGEDNDTLVTATPVTFSSSGQATIANAILGNGTAGIRDVDLYRITMPNAGQISAEIEARRLPGGSSLDSVLRLFDANGVELNKNDQYFGQDSFINYFVRTPGDYYIGVSGFGNDAYNPRILGSGNTQSTGVYTLKLRAAVSTSDVVRYTYNANAAPGQPALPVAVPPAGLTQGTTSSRIFVPESRRILDVNVRLNIQHPNVSDLRISLIGPDNTQVTLFNQRGANGDDLGTRNSNGVPIQYTIFDDEQPVNRAIANGTAPFLGSWVPEQFLSAFDGKVASGNWTLVVNDTKPLDAGFIFDWDIEFRFENDIFGPFEANDSLNDADQAAQVGQGGANLGLLSGFATQSRTAFIGDGGFGALDRDVYRLEVAAGSSISVLVTPTGTLNTALRLFDAQGNQVRLSNPTDRTSSGFENFIFATGGVYYLAVSEGANTAYNPLVVATGTAAVTSGQYTLSVSVSPGVSDPNVELSGTQVRAITNTRGTFGELGTNANEALSYRGVEFLRDQQSFVGAAFGGSGFLNSQAQVEQGFTITLQSDPTNNRALATTQFRGLKIDRTITFGRTDSFVAIDVLLTNVSTSTLAQVAWAEGLNPNPGLVLDEDTQLTLNDVTPNGKAAVARYVNNVYPAGLFMGLVAANTDGRAKATVLLPGTVVRDAAVLVNAPALDPNGLAGDGQLALSYNMGDIAPGQSVALRYFVIFASSQAEFDGLVASANNGTGTGHLTFNPNAPANETLSNGQQVPTLPYRYYYPEGFLGPNIFTFLPMANPSDEPADVVVIQRFEGTSLAQRDRIVDAFTIPGRARRGVDVNTPQFYKDTLRFLPQVAATGLVTVPDLTTPNPNDTVQLPPGLPYALEIRSTRPIAPTFSYYDLTQIPSGPVAVGESFTQLVQNVWTFAEAARTGNDFTVDGIRTYIVLQNPSAQEAKVTATVYNTQTGDRFRTTEIVAPNGRAGVFLNAQRWDNLATTIEETPANGNALYLADGVYGVLLESDLPIVAAKSTYNPILREATGTIGNTGRGATTGLAADGQFGLRNSSETIGILNTNAEATQVRLEFLFANGTTDRRTIDVPANAHRNFQLASLANFPAGQAYSVFYESALPVSISSTVPVNQLGRQDAFSVTTATQAYTYWGFGEGFRPGDTVDWNPAPGFQAHPGVTENIRIYNPSAEDVTIEITLNFDVDAGQETFRRTVSGRRVAEFNIDQFVPGNRRLTNQSYGIFVKAPSPIVASMDRFDLLFPGGFATLGVPLGRISAIS